MMKTCPECGSNEIIPDLVVYASETIDAQNPIYVFVTEPRPEKVRFGWIPKQVGTGFRASVCGACGYTRFYTKHYKELLDAYKQGYQGEPPALKGLLPV
jgi:predicted nucleic-acid-binding Zn-ribbon protein